MHVRGRILDSAFTLTWEPTYNKLLEAVKASTNAGIRVSLNVVTDVNTVFIQSDYRQLVLMSG